MFRKIIASFLILIFAVIALPLAVIFGVYNTFSESGFYENELVDLTFEFVVQTTPEGEIQKFVRSNLDREDVKALVEDVMSQIRKAKIDGNGGELKIVVPLSSLREKFGPAASKLTSLDDFDLTLQQTPKGISGSLTEILARSFLIAMVVLGGILVVLLGLIALLIFRPWQRILRYCSAALMIASIHLVIIFGVLNFLPEIYDFLHAQVPAQITPGMLQLYNMTYDVFVGNLSQSVLLVALPIFLLSLGFFIFGFVIDKSHDAS